MSMWSWFTGAACPRRCGGACVRIGTLGERFGAFKSSWRLETFCVFFLRFRTPLVALLKLSGPLLLLDSCSVATRTKIGWSTAFGRHMFSLSIAFRAWSLLSNRTKALRRLPPSASRKIRRSMIFPCKPKALSRSVSVQRDGICVTKRLLLTRCPLGFAKPTFKFFPRTFFPFNPLIFPREQKLKPQSKG